MEKDLTLDGEHTTQYTDDVLQNCALETYNFINQVHPNNFSKSLKTRNKINKMALVLQRHETDMEAY